ncbi:MAG: FMN-binding negative transcriptional regulator [Methylococcales bacterium]|nr:FMN-binding negative transcriptional regulator [Methylococcales bacterium]
MYIPEQFAEEDFNRLSHLIQSHPFGMLITSHQDLPYVSHLPFIFERLRT